MVVNGAVSTTGTTDEFNLRSRIGHTPVVNLKIRVGKRGALLRLKLESFNPCGSSKDRTALALFDSVAARTDRRAGLIESTSGNLGIALAAVSRTAGIPFTAVVDPRTPWTSLATLRRLGAAVVVVTEPDEHGGHLLGRLRRLQAMLTEEPALTWTNQYENPANPRAHELGTAPELAEQVGRSPVVLAPISTGGTVAGLRSFARRETGWTVIGVDVRGSYAVHHVPGRRVLPGIGSSRASSFLSEAPDPVELVASSEAVSACLWLRKHSGIAVGGSSGAVVAAALNLIGAGRADDIACICPDGEKGYLDTVYSPPWRAVHDLSFHSFPATVESVDWVFADADAMRRS